MNVNTLLEGSSPYQVLSKESAKLAGKWEKSGLLEGIESSTERNNMSMLLENQAKQLVNEANQVGTDSSFSAGNSEAWAGVSLPLVRRIFGEIVAKDFERINPALLIDPEEGCPDGVSNKLLDLGDNVSIKVNT